MNKSSSTGTPVKCSQCGQQLVKLVTEGQSVDDVTGATCTTCKINYSEDQVRAQIVKGITAEIDPLGPMRGRSMNRPEF